MNTDYKTECENLEAVEKNGLAIMNISNPSLAVQVKAVMQNGFAIQFIKNAPEFLQCLAARQNGLSIQHMFRPSELVQYEAVKNDYRAFLLIDSPSARIKDMVDEFLDRYLEDIDDFEDQQKFRKVVFSRSKLK